MQQKGSSTLLFLAIFFLIVGLSSGGLKMIKEASDYAFQVWGDSKNTVFTENEDGKINSEPDPKKEINPADDTDVDVVIETEVEQDVPDVPFDNESFQETLEKLDTEKTVTTPPPLVVENKYGGGGEGALSVGGIILFTNAERDKMGLDTLSQNDFLMQAATAKLNHMFDNQYFEHVAPSGEDVSYWAGKAAYKYITVGENLALGNFKDNEDIVTAWMESPGHRANILKESYEEIGVATGFGEFDGDEVWLGVQIFATPLSACPPVDETLKVQIDIYDARVKETEATLSSLQSVIAERGDPETQSEYEVYLDLVEQYNKLVAKHNEIVADLRFSVNAYNDQVRAFNACIATK